MEFGCVKVLAVSKALEIVLSICSVLSFPEPAKEGTISSKNVMKQCCMCRMRRAGWSLLFGS